MYDVIVIGAGPTGSTASKVLAERGYKVLMVEKFLVKAYYGESVPASAMCEPTENRGMIITDDKGNTFRFEQPGLNIWRSSFDK